MSIAVPIRLKITSGGVVLGYVETLDLASGLTATFSGPVASLTAAGGTGGGDAATLGGHPPSYFGTAAADASQVTSITALQATDAVFTIELGSINATLANLLNRALMWSAIGVAVQASPPISGITHAQWLAGNAGNWGWIRIP